MLSSLIHRPSPGRPARCQESWSELRRAGTGSRSPGGCGLGGGQGLNFTPTRLCPPLSLPMPCEDAGQSFPQSVLCTYCVSSSVRPQWVGGRCMTGWKASHAVFMSMCPCPAVLDRAGDVPLMSQGLRRGGEGGGSKPILCPLQAGRYQTFLKSNSILPENLQGWHYYSTL